MHIHGIHPNNEAIFQQQAQLKKAPPKRPAQEDVVSIGSRTQHDEEDEQQAQEEDRQKDELEMAKNEDTTAREQTTGTIINVTG